MVNLLEAFRAVFIWANLLPPSSKANDVHLSLLSRTQDLGWQPPPHVRYEASLTSLLLPIGHSGYHRTSSSANHTSSGLPLEFEDWIARSRAETAKFDRLACRALRVYNRRITWRRGECHIEVTAPEEHGCKSTWAPAFQVVPGWWERVIIGARGRSDGFHEQSPATKEWLLEREITLTHVFSRHSRCGAAAPSGEKVDNPLSEGSGATRPPSMSKPMLAESRESGGGAGENPAAGCPAASSEPAPLHFDVALVLAEEDMAARGLRKPLSPDVVPAGLAADVFTFDESKHVCWLRESHECVNGRRAKVCV